jgi:serine/threonine-protein kinase RsbW
VILLRMPGTLAYRDLAVRAVQSACKLVGGGASRLDPDFDDHVVSAFGEAFNNIALHAFRGRPIGDVQIEIDISSDAMTIRMIDEGHSFDLAAVPEPDFDELPETGMGVYIIRSFMDHVAYHTGVSNVLTMTKLLRRGSSSVTSSELRSEGTKP